MDIILYFKSSRLISFMKNIIFIIVLSLMIGCSPITEDPYSGEQTLNPSEINEIVYQGCDYIVYDHGVAEHRVFSITHKGNCRNSIHKQN